MTTFHSVMDKPEPVNLVMPPSMTWMVSIPTPKNTQLATEADGSGEKGFFIMPAKVREELFRRAFKGPLTGGCPGTLASQWGKRSRMSP